jgi:lysophospholipase L1-like esterase
MNPIRAALLILCFSAASGPAVAAPQVAPVEKHIAGLHRLPSTVHGRVLLRSDGFVRQWPGTYFETAFSGRSAYFSLGPGQVIAHVLIDGKVVYTLMRPAAAMFRVNGLAAGMHRIRIEIANESQDRPSIFGGFFATRAVKGRRIAARIRQIEFIGDSYTVGYGNQSPTRDCTEKRVWETTDTSEAFGPLLAKRYGADYQVNAISGRGVVRSYDGAKVDPLPAAYPFVLFDKAQVYRDPRWRPQLIVVGLGTNDFSTQLHAGEKWRSREELRADFEASYVRFVQELRSHNQRAFFLLWATDTAEGEVAAETKRVVERLQADGERRVAFLEVPGLAFTGCNYHPSIADDRTIADRLARVIEAQVPFGR